MPRVDACRREITELHAFFVDWYGAECDRGEFARMERAIGPGFEMVTPEGDVLDRTAVLEMVRDRYGSAVDATFDIDIRNVEGVTASGECAVVRYEEWQTTGEGETGRVSTATFREAEAPAGVRWRHLHETLRETGAD